LGCAGFGLLRGLSSAGSEPGPIAYWLTDRDANLVIGLDENLIEVRELELPSPLRAQARDLGGAWIAHTPQGTPLSPQVLVELGPEGVALSSTPVQALLDLSTLDGGDALAVELGSDGSQRVLQVRGGTLPLVLARLPGVTCVAGARWRVLIGTSVGDLQLLPAAGAIGIGSKRVHLGGSLVDVAAASDGWWALDAAGGAGGSRLIRLDAELSLRWEVRCGVAALSLIPDVRRDRVWLADVNEPSLRRFGPGGELELALDALPTAGLDRGLAMSNGGALLVAPGALLRIDDRGRLSPGQGGFDFLTDVASAGGAGH
jgi:hypothetical protein